MARPNLNYLLSCRTCDKYVPNDPGDPEKHGGCRAAPPSVLMIGTMQNRLTGQVSPNIVTVWPGVGQQGDWCALHPLYEPPKLLHLVRGAATEKSEPAAAKPDAPIVSTGNGSH